MSEQEPWPDGLPVARSPFGAPLPPPAARPRTAVAFSTDAAHFYVNWDVNSDDVRGAAYW